MINLPENKKVKVALYLSLVILLLVSNSSYSSVFEKQTFTDSDAILVMDDANNEIFSWQANKALIPASLTKLATAKLAIDKWGLDYRFYTDFIRYKDQLWVKGYGDPYLVSEELDRLVIALNQTDLSWVKSLHIDGSYFANEAVPGRSTVNDPYNAPLSAVAANFNTAKLRKDNGVIQSAEAQTPLTQIARRLGQGIGSKAERVNLRSRQNSEKNVAQLLALKLGNKQWPVYIGNKAPHTEYFYRHINSHDVRSIIRGMLEYSNNFMANQLFLMLSDVDDKACSVSFLEASKKINASLKEHFNWQAHILNDGAGLTRDNRLSAQQIDQLLVALEPHKTLFKQSKNPHAEVHAKTGTLNGVRSFAGYIELPDQRFRFVFIFNRSMPWRYREQLLDKLVEQLVKEQTKSKKPSTSNITFRDKKS